MFIRELWPEVSFSAKRELKRIGKQVKGSTTVAKQQRQYLKASMAVYYHLRSILFSAIKLYADAYSVLATTYSAMFFTGCT